MEQIELPLEEDHPGEQATASQLPKPSGYQLLIALPEIEEKYESGLLKADQVRHHDEIYSVVGFVLELGPDAYKDVQKFPTGPWCKKGDFVLMGALRGTRFRIHGKEFRLLPDDCILAVVSDPRGYSRA